MSCDLAKNPTRRLGFEVQILNANSIDLGSISTSSSQMRTDRVEMEGRGRKREFRLLEGWRTTEMGAEEAAEERLCESRARVWGGVEGFPQRTSTAAIDGEAE